MDQPRRQRYSMNYQCYESAQVTAKEKHRRMIDYMFPGYELKDTRTWHERNEQTDLSFWNFTGSTQRLKDENDFKDFVEEKKEEDHINLRDALLLCDENARSASLAPHGWVGPPLTIKLKLFDMLFMEVTNVAKNPRLIKMHSNALDESTLKIHVLPGPKYVPQVMITLGSKKIFPDGEEHASVIGEQIVPRYPSTLFTSINGENTQDMRSFMNNEDQVQFRFNEFLTNNESIPIEKQEVYLPKSWTDVIKMEAPVLIKKEYRLHTYDIKHEDEVVTKSSKPLKVILPERDDLEKSCKRKIITDTNLADDKVYLYNPFTKMENLPKHDEDQDVQDHLRLKSHKSEIWETVEDEYETPTPPPNDDIFEISYQCEKCISQDLATPLPPPEVSYVVPLDRKEFVYATPLPSPKHSYVVPVSGKRIVYATPLPSPNKSYAIPVGKFVKNAPFQRNHNRN